MAAGVSFAPEDFAYTFRTGMCPLRRRRAFLRRVGETPATPCGRKLQPDCGRFQKAQFYRKRRLSACSLSTCPRFVIGFHSTEPEIKTCRLKAHGVLSWGASRLRFGAPAGIIVWLPSKGGYANCRFPIISAFRIIVKCLQYPQKTMHSFFWGVGKFQVNNYLC